MFGAVIFTSTSKLIFPQNNIFFRSLYQPDFSRYILWAEERVMEGEGVWFVVFWPNSAANHLAKCVEEGEEEVSLRDAGEMSLWHRPQVAEMVKRQMSIPVISAHRWRCGPWRLSFVQELEVTHADQHWLKWKCIGCWWQFFQNGDISSKYKTLVARQEFSYFLNIGRTLLAWQVSPAGVCYLQEWRGEMPKRRAACTPAWLATSLPWNLVFLTKQMENLELLLPSSPKAIGSAAVIIQRVRLWHNFSSPFSANPESWVGHVNRKQKVKSIFAEKGMIPRTGQLRQCRDSRAYKMP